MIVSDLNVICIFARVNFLVWSLNADPFYTFARASRIRMQSLMKQRHLSQKQPQVVAPERENKYISTVHMP